jgi:hypothetical protein
MRFGIVLTVGDFGINYLHSTSAATGIGVMGFIQPFAK